MKAAAGARPTELPPQPPVGAVAALVECIADRLQCRAAQCMQNSYHCLGIQGHAAAGGGQSPSPCVAAGSEYC